MLSARRLSSMAWIVPISSSEDLLLSGCSDEADPHHVHAYVGLVTTNPTDFSTVIIDSEIWSSRIFTVTPVRTMTSILQQLVRCHTPEIPVELVYKWGGELKHRRIQLAHNEVSN
jgi:hypothetical protein